MTTSNDDEIADKPTEQMKITPVVTLHQVPDVNLGAIASIADFVGFPLTLYMPWGIAVGHTVAPNEYYKHLADTARSGTLPDDVPEGWADVIDKFAEQNFDPYAELTPSERNENAIVDGFDLTSHINLKNAVCWIGGFPQPTRHEYLRIRLADVSAWAWGAATE